MPQGRDEQRLERLVDLVLYLLDAERPRTLAEIAAEIPGYPPGREARRQAFERDKRLLADEGIVVSVEPVDGPEQYGYRIRPEHFFLQGLELDDEERAALSLAAAFVFLGDATGTRALRRLGIPGIVAARLDGAAVPAALGVPPAARGLVASVPLTGPVGEVFEAIGARRQVAFSYRGEHRQVSPWALRCARGRWYLVGLDHRRGAQRTYRLDRIESATIEVLEEQAADPPEPEALEAPIEPWRFGEGEEPAYEAVVVVEREQAEAARQELEGRARLARHDGRLVATMRVTNVEGFVSWLLGFGEYARLLAPEELRAAVLDWLTQIAADEVPRPARSGGAAGPAHAPAPRRPSPVRPVAGRLEELLAILSYLARRPGEPVALSELEAAFGRDRQELVQLLEFAACCGVPPYDPAALLEIVVEADSVTARLDPSLSRPRRLAASEAVALLACVRAVQAVEGSDPNRPLGRAAAKLERALGGHADRLAVELGRPAALEALEAALAAGTQVELEYFSVASERTETRTVDPFALFEAEGRWYLEGWCHRAGAERRFRVDRVLAVVRTGRSRCHEPAGAGPGAEDAVASLPAPYVASPEAVAVRLALAPAGRWLIDAVPEARTEPDGTVVVSVSSWPWFERLMLQLGPHATVLHPPEARRRRVEAARRLLARERLEGPPKGASH
jgi:predicted DNA-binding transcriptional regulator YafY